MLFTLFLKMSPTQREKLQHVDAHRYQFDTQPAAFQQGSKFLRLSGVRAVLLAWSAKRSQRCSFQFVANFFWKISMIHYDSTLPSPSNLGSQSKTFHIKAGTVRDTKSTYVQSFKYLPVKPPASVVSAGSAGMLRNFETPWTAHGWKHWRVTFSNTKYSPNMRKWSNDSLKHILCKNN